MKETKREIKKPGYTRKVKELIKERNRLRNRTKEKGGVKRWIEKCKEVVETLRKERQEDWRRYVEGLDTKTNSKQVWNTIRSMDGRRSQRKENEALVIDGKGYASDKDKAKQFAKVYKAVSILPKVEDENVTIRDKNIKQRNREFLRKVPESRGRYEQELSEEELMRAIEGAKNNKAPGEDTIPYEIIKKLGPKAREYLLHLYNRIWSGEEIPQAWRTAVILPLLKEGKDPEKPGSYRPISLTDCLGKILEKIIAERLSSYMEEHKLFNECQAGFRQGRCTSDQVWKLVQTATDKIQTKRDKGLATLVTFFDFERAYDKVWRDGLISKMINMNIPYAFIKYTRLFLSARRTTVEINGTRSKEFYLNQGLPQGSAISPLLFLLFINDITDFMSPGATPSLFADDTAASVECGKDKEKAVRKMQDNIDGIDKWAKTWKMKLNAGKTQVMVISTSNADTDWQPKLTLEGKELEVVKEYKFLGVTIDRKLNFASHVNKIIAKTKKRARILKCLAGKDWGQTLETQVALYITYIRSSLEYAAPTWYPWISKTSRNKLEQIQNECLRSMTRMAKTTPLEFLRLQAGSEPLEARIEKNCMIQWERFARLEQDDSRRVLAEKEVKTRVKTKAGWREKTKGKMDNNICRDIPRIPTNPMMKNRAVVTGVELEKNKNKYTLHKLAELTEMKIAEIDADVELYTDGSTSGEQQNGGAGVFAQDKLGNVLLEVWKAAGKLCSSYDGECVAMRTALEWIEEDDRGDIKYAIFTDSLSLTSALKSNDWKDTHEWLRAIKVLLRADQLAERGAKLTQTEIPVTFRIVKAKIKNLKWELSNEKAKKTYGERRRPKDIEQTWPAEIRRLYGRLRSNHEKSLRDYQHRFLKTDMTCMCIHCDSEAAETIEHVLLECPALEERRMRMFRERVEMKDLVDQPEKCRQFLVARFEKLNDRRKLVEDEGGGSSQ